MVREPHHAHLRNTLRLHLRNTLRLHLRNTLRLHLRNTLRLHLRNTLRDTLGSTWDTLRFSKGNIRKVLELLLKKVVYVLPLQQSKSALWGLRYVRARK